MSIEDLNRSFAITGIATVVRGENGLPKIHISTPEAEAEIYLYGAQITSWKPAHSQEALFLSKQSHFAPGKAIRGGVPVCFPWFRSKAGNPSAPSHGTVRTKSWQIEAIEQTADGVEVRLFITSDEASRQYFAGEFHVKHCITVGKKLRLQLTITNTGTESFRFEEAQHTYYHVGDAERVTVSGLDGAHYLDNTDGNAEKIQAGDIAFSKSTDNAYQGTVNALAIHDPALNRTIMVRKNNSLTTVVWNPWSTGAATLPDLGNDEWRHFVCVEAGNILANSVELQPGTGQTLTTEVTIEA